jgi:hypothetical protein
MVSPTWQTRGRQRAIASSAFVQNWKSTRNAHRATATDYYKRSLAAFAWPGRLWSAIVRSRGWCPNSSTQCDSRKVIRWPNRLWLSRYRLAWLFTIDDQSKSVGALPSQQPTLPRRTGANRVPFTQGDSLVRCAIRSGNFAQWHSTRKWLALVACRPLNSKRKWRARQDSNPRPLGS